ncbi:hypothetical protein JOC86_001200 [Bacillus pakistanensis]|uniref:YqgU-like 6-bladed beta-propeller domain-containing protein n=1 Tax=Rossellomorea pakistanensis TaxID=992288 RepID=A0ABS2N9Z8_9BACI|nr:hypothetical protein [Bacillus pakistanensis]MBM7584663.1 hypothetical protein [Bacillus pakistanensis]
MEKNRIASFMLLFITACILFGCTNSKASPSQKNDIENIKKEPDQTEAEILPLEISENSFQKIVGWVDEENILFLHKVAEQTHLTKYNVFTGQSKTIYKSDQLVIDAKISPSSERVLIHTAPLTYSATVTIIDMDGNPLASQDVPSKEIYYNWNESDDNLLFIVSFAEDWSYQTYILNTSNNELESIQTPEPFIKWHTLDSYLYQDWGEDTISISAPIYSQNIDDHQEKSKIVDSSIHFQKFSNELLSVFMKNQEDGKATYQFFSEIGEVTAEFTVPLISRYSDWLIPYYDMIEESEVFLTLAANSSGTVDTYNDKFTLTSWNVKTQKESKVLEGLDNEPLSCSKNYCLFGFQFEKIIDLKEKVLIPLVQFKKG